MVKPGGTGRPRLAISASPAPLPPRRSRMLGLPSARPPPKPYTHLPFDNFRAGRAGALGLGFEALRGDGFFFALALEDFRLAMGHQMLEGLMALKSTASTADASPDSGLLDKS